METQLVTQLVGLAVAAGGGGAHDEHLDWWVIGATITNALLFFGYLAIKLRPAVGTALASRRDNMAKQLEEAQKKQREAEAKLEEYKGKLANLEQEIERIVGAYESEAKADSERMQAETERAIERLARENEFTIKQEMRKAEGAIRDLAINVTMELAEQLVKERITDADRRRLADQYISSLDKGGDAARGS